jgi:CRP-like cAMP-binding protein
MHKAFERYLRDKATFTESELDAISLATTSKKLRKRQYLLQEGDIWRQYAFVCEGSLRTYFIDEKGSEHIMKFSTENWWAGDRESLINEVPSKLNIDALEDSVLVIFTKKDYDELKATIPTFDKMTADLLSRTYMAANQRIQTAISASTEEKYERFLQQYPGLINRVPMHMIATFLGVTAETLSRVRSSSFKK